MSITRVLIKKKHSRGSWFKLRWIRWWMVVCRISAYWQRRDHLAGMWWRWSRHSATTWIRSRVIFTLREPNVYKPHGFFLGFLATFICFCVTVLFYRYLYFVVNQIKLQSYKVKLQSYKVKVSTIIHNCARRSKFWKKRPCWSTFLTFLFGESPSKGQRCREVKWSWSRFLMYKWIIWLVLVS